jgi:hypothetical protein
MLAGTPASEPYALWWFVTRPVVRGTCDIGVFVPDAAAAPDFASGPTTFHVIRGRTDPAIVSYFGFDQTTNRGRWVDVGTYPVDGGTIAVQLVSRDSPVVPEMHAAAQVRVDCRQR